MVKAHEILQWELGDWLIEGKDDGQLDDKRLRQEAEKATKLAWGTLKNYMVTARAIPPARDGAPSRRRDGTDGRPELSFSIHVEVAKFDDETQERLLKIVEEGQCKFPYDPRFPSLVCLPATSVRDLQQVIGAMKERGLLPMTAAEVRRREQLRARESTKVVKIRLSEADYFRLERISKLKYDVRFDKPSLGLSFVEKLLRWMTTEYCKEHKADFDAMIAADEAKVAAYRAETE